MTQTKSTKKALLMSMLSMLICIAMLVGSTFAWFTDSVTSGNNRIMAGNLDVDLLMDKGDGDGYVSIADGTGDIFSEAAGNGINWEPGKTEIVYLAVRNMGSLALKYNIMLNVTDEGLLAKSADGSLTTSLEYAILDGMKYGELSAKSWAELLETDGVQTGDLIAGVHRAAEKGCLDQINYSGEAQETDYFAFAVHMKEAAGNEYQEKGAVIDMTVIAGQAQAENDSFGNDYDAEAPYADYVVDSPEGLKQALGEINGNEEVEKGVIKAGKDFEYDDESLEVDSEKDIVIDLNGHNLTLENDTRDGLIVSGGGTLTLTNSGETGKYKFSTTDDMCNSIFVNNTEEDKVTTLVLEDVDIEINNTVGKQVSIHAYAPEGKSVIEFGDGAVVTMTGTQHFAGVQLSKNGEMNMTGGIINVNCETKNQDPSGVVLDGEGAVLNMSGGTINVNGTGSILGVEIGNGNGTFNMTGGVINVTSGGTDATAVGMAFSGTLNLSGGTLKVAATGGVGYGIGIYSASNLKYMSVHLSGDFTIEVNDSAGGVNTDIVEDIKKLLEDPENTDFTDTRTKA